MSKTQSSVFWVSSFALKASPPTMNNYRNRPRRQINLTKNKNLKSLRRFCDGTLKESHDEHTQDCAGHGKLQNATDCNFKEIYSKVEMASSLLRSKSADRQQSAISRYERQRRKYRSGLNPSSKSSTGWKLSESQSLSRRNCSNLIRSKSPKLKVSNSLIKNMKPSSSIPSNSCSTSRKIGPKFVQPSAELRSKKVIHNGSKNSFLGSRGKKRDVSNEMFQQYLIPKQISPHNQRLSPKNLSTDREKIFQELGKCKSKHKKLKGRFKRVIEDNKNLRVLNKGLNKVVDEIIAYLTRVLRSEQDNQVANKIINIFNNHHEEITKKSIKARGDSILREEVSTSFSVSVMEKESHNSSKILSDPKIATKPLDRLLPNELGQRKIVPKKELKIFHPKILWQREAVNSSRVIDSFQSPIIDTKNFHSTLEGFRENLEKVDMILKGCSKDSQAKFSSLREVSCNIEAQPRRLSEKYSSKKPKLCGLMSKMKSGHSRNVENVVSSRSEKIKEN
ncbi:unnamed protein product [Moneuplotes crassus]|uniref:Uncharacterized protein n=1 Tax=Euplotes crassus TaxID=5936 RepID=A0AAD1Y6Q8_EUPCR|nr:unnamed protein product [Moneuplotes crassus]